MSVPRRSIVRFWSSTIWSSTALALLCRESWYGGAYLRYMGSDRTCSTRRRLRMSVVLGGLISIGRMTASQAVDRNGLSLEQMAGRGNRNLAEPVPTDHQQRRGQRNDPQEGAAQRDIGVSQRRPIARLVVNRHDFHDTQVVIQADRRIQATDDQQQQQVEAR